MDILRSGRLALEVIFDRKNLIHTVNESGKVCMWFLVCFLLLNILSQKWIKRLFLSFSNALQTEVCSYFWIAKILYPGIFKMCC